MSPKIWIIFPVALVLIIVLILITGKSWGEVIQPPEKNISYPHLFEITFSSPDSYLQGQYQQMYCSKIDFYNLEVRQTAADAVRKHSGSYEEVGVNQILDIYDWVQDKIIYLNVPTQLLASPYSSSETLSTKSGDCKSQAVLLASLINSIGGNADVVLQPSCQHVYVMVYFGPENSTNLSDFSELIQNNYADVKDINYFRYHNGLWVVFDPTGGEYPGDVLTKCTNKRDPFFVESCVELPS